MNLLKQRRLSWLLALLFVLPAFPQASTAALSGTVRDQAGAVIIGAPVLLTNTATNTTLRAASNEAGSYLFPGVVPGPYRISAEIAGMQKFEATLTIQVQQSAVVDIVLKVGQTSAEVSVTDVTPVVTVDNPTLGHTLERSRIEQLPINGRAVTNLLQTVPGMEGLRAYGMRFMTQEMSLDGASLVDTHWGNGVFGRQPGLDTIQEMKVENNNSSAKFTRPMTIVLSTKSGTNQLHGSAFLTNRNSGYGVARARTDYFSKPPQLNRNEFGMSAGGPVYLPRLYDGRNKTFWFVGYEGYRIVNPSFKGISVPTEAMRNGDFSGLIDAQGRLSVLYNPYTTDTTTWARQPFAHGGKLNVIDPALMSPLAKNLFAMTPMPTHPNVNPLLDSNWWGEWPSWTRQWTVSIRFDHNFSDNDRFYVRYTPATSENLNMNWSFPTLAKDAGTMHVNSPVKSLALSYVRIVSPTVFNEVLVSGSRQVWYKGSGWDDYGPYATTNWGEKLGLPNLFNTKGWMGIGRAGLTLPGYMFDCDSPQGYWFTHLIVDNNLTKLAGKHELEMGFHYRYDQSNTYSDIPMAGLHEATTLATSLYDSASSRTAPQSTPLTGSNLANLYLGVLNYANAMPPKGAYMRGRDYALYFQDNFKVSSRLTLNLGLRWEYYPARSEKNNTLISFDKERRAIVMGTTMEEMYRLGMTLPSIVSREQALGVKFLTYQDVGVPQNLTSSSAKDFGPRLGFAYRAGSGAGSFIVRGGYRMSYFPMNMRNYTYAFKDNPPLAARFSYSLTDATLSPDGVSNLGLRSVPAVIGGNNSSTAISADATSGLNRGSFSVTHYGKVQQQQPRVQDWNLTLEKEVSRNTVARVAYIGSHSGRLGQFYAYNNATPDNIWYLTTGQPIPTGEYANVARRPYDQTVYGGVRAFLDSGWMNSHAMQFELERQYTRGYGFQLFYVVNNALGAIGPGGSGFVPGGDAQDTVPAINQFLPGEVPADYDQRNRFLNYRRDTSIPKHRVRWNWVVDLPFGKGKMLGRNAGALIDKFIGGWQLAGMGSLYSRYWTLPTNIWPNGSKLEIYGYKYPIEDCTSGTCYPGYLWFNGYIPSNRINSTDPRTGKPNGIMGVPADYKPAGQPLIPWGSTALPANAPANTNVSTYWDTNTIWVPLKNGAVQRTTDPSLHPWRYQSLPGPMIWGLDASLFKSVMITERIYLRFNVDAFNVLNHPGDPSGVGSNGVLSTRSSGQGARQLQLTLRLTW